MVQKCFKVRPVFRFSLKLKEQSFPTNTWKFLHLHTTAHGQQWKGHLSTPGWHRRNSSRIRSEANRKVLSLQVPNCRVRGTLTAGLWPLTSDLWLTSWAGRVKQLKEGAAGLTVSFTISGKYKCNNLQPCSSLLPHKCQLVSLINFYSKCLNTKASEVAL